MFHMDSIRVQLARGTAIACVAAAMAGCSSAPELGTQRPTSVERAQLDADNANVRTEQLALVQQSLPAAQSGNADAEFKVGSAYEKLGDLHDSSSSARNRQAAKWYRMAADQGHSEAERSLGAILINRQGVQSDRQEAVLWFKRAAGQGNAKAQANLAALYEEGLGVAENHDEAVKWYQQAALNGDPAAQANIANLHVEGRARSVQ